LHVKKYLYFNGGLKAAFFFFHQKTAYRFWFSGSGR